MILLKSKSDTVKTRHLCTWARLCQSLQPMIETETIAVIGVFWESKMKWEGVFTDSVLRKLAVEIE